MDSISTARDFFINQQGLSSNEADMLVSKGMEAYNQQSQPQNMMQMASGGIARMGYQMGGGIGTMPMDYGQSLQVPQQMPTNFSSAQSITSNPLLNYGQPQMRQAGGTPLSMNRGGIARLGYQEGGEAMMQPQGMQQEQGMGQQGDPQQAILTIIQLLIEAGIDPEQARDLAEKILQIFAQGGEPALNQFISQLEQQEQTEAMAQGGIAGYGYRQGYAFGGIGKIFKSAAKAVSGVVKGVASAVKSVAKSPIGMIALSIAAPYAIGAFAPGFATLGGTGFMGAALRAGISNSLIQLVATGKINPKQALIAGIGGGVSQSVFGPAGGTNVDASNAVNDVSNITGNVDNVITTSPVSSASTSQVLSSPDAGAAMYTDYPSPITSNAANISTSGDVGTGYAVPKPNLPYQLQGANTGSTIDMNAVTNDYSYPGTLDKIQTSASNFGTDMLNKAQTGIQNLYKDPLGTITKLAGSAYDTAKENIVPLSIGAAAGYTLGSPQGKDESDEDFAKRQQDEVNPLITYYGRNLQIKNPYFYQKFGATNPFENAAQGGIMGYKRGGSMVPPARQIEGGVIELDARKSGGYIPYGKKERVDDVPAMLAKDEFVFTSRAVKAAGGGSAKRGAAKMYALMKQLEGARS